MISEITSFLAGGIITGMAVLPYAFKCDRRMQELIDDNEQQAHVLANACAQLHDADHRCVDAALQRSEDAAVIDRLNRMITASEAEISSLNERVYTMTLEYQALTAKRA